MPTGTGNDWSEIGCAATKNHPFLPLHPKDRLHEVIRRNGIDALFAQNLLRKETIPLVSWRSTPGIPPIACLSGKQARRKQRTA